MFQEYDFEVIVQLGCLNVGPDHMSCIETRDEPTNFEKGLPDVQLFAMKIVDSHFEDIIHFLMTGSTPEGYSCQQKMELVVCVTYFPFIARNLYKMGSNEIFRRYVLDFE